MKTTVQSALRALNSAVTAPISRKFERTNVLCNMCSYLNDQDKGELRRSLLIEPNDPARARAIVLTGLERQERVRIVKRHIPAASRREVEAYVRFQQARRFEQGLTITLNHVRD